MDSTGDRDPGALGAALDALRVGLLLVDGDEVVEFANAHFAHLFAGSAAPLGRPIAALGDDLAQAGVYGIAHWRDARMSADGDPAPIDLRLRDGRTIEVKERARTGGAGSVLLWSDVTDLRRQTARLTDVIEASVDGFAFFDAGGRLDLWNDEFSIAIGGQAGVSRGQTIGAILAAARGAGRVELIGDPPPFDHVADDRRRRDFLLQHKDGRQLRLRVRPAREAGSVAVVTDITAERPRADVLAQRGAELAETASVLRETRARLRMQTASLLGLKEELYRARREASEAERAKKAFLRALTHELRTPLNSIIGFSDGIEHQLHGPVGAREYVEYGRNIGESGHRLLRVIDRILDITRLESGLAELAADAAPLAPIAREVAEARAERAAAAGVRIVIDLPDDLPDAHAEDGAVRAMLDNLLDNAIAHTPTGGAVTVSARADADRISLTVSDDGCGIAAADLERVMLPFEQAGSSDAVENQGAGLGLPIVRALAEALDGAFELSSTLGRGTQAVITLRASAETRGETEAA